MLRSFCADFVDAHSIGVGLATLSVWTQRLEFEGAK